MMLKVPFLSLVLAGLALAAVGCKSDSAGMSSGGSMTMPKKAVVVNAGQDKYTVYVPDDKGGVAMMAGDKQAAHCAQCEKDAAMYFKTGEMTKSCPACGAIRTPISGTN